MTIATREHEQVWRRVSYGHLGILIGQGLQAPFWRHVSTHPKLQAPRLALDQRSEVCPLRVTYSK